MSLFDAGEPPQETLLQQILDPLLQDFIGWFDDSKTFLEAETTAQVLSPEHCDGLLQRVMEAQSQVNTMRTLLLSTEGQVGVDTAMVQVWHRLVMECWQAARTVREQTPPKTDGIL
jgi:hypothetical protein